MQQPSLVFDVHQFKEVPSTNEVAKDLANQGGKDGVIVVADRQTRGRGRGKRAWHSPAGGLYCSVLLSAKDPARVTDLALLSGVAVCQAVREFLPKSCEVSVKWPNDCLIGNKKVAGILCESSGSRPELCVVGIGINVNTSATELAPFNSNPFPATSFAAECDQGAFALEKVLSTLMKKVGGLYQLYQVEGFPAIRYLWQKNNLMLGKKVEFSESSELDLSLADRARQPVHSGIFLGIDETGAAVIAQSDGVAKRYYSGEITCYWPST